MAQEDQDKEDGRYLKPEFRTRACAIQFPGTAGCNPTLVDPFDGSLHEVTTTGIISSMQGKRCIACTGSNWFLVLDEVTRESFLTTLLVTSPAEESETSTVVPLPPIPADVTYLEFLVNCVLSAPAPTVPGCIVVLGRARETYLRYCRVGDKGWSEVEVTFDEVGVFNGVVAWQRGKIYATTNGSYSVVIDAATPAPEALRVEKIDISIPGPSLGHDQMIEHLVMTPSSNDGGDLYFVRSYLFGNPEEVIGVDVCRWDRREDAWREVDSIGDTTLFVGANCAAVSPATEAGTEPNSIHILRPYYDGVRVFTVLLLERTVRCNFVGIGRDDDSDNDDDDTDPPAKAYWFLPSSARFKLEASRQSNREGDEKEESIALPDPEQVSECTPRWSSLPIDLLAAHVTPRLSFIDFLHLKSVCKDWSGITTPILDTKSWPLLLTPSTCRSQKGGSLDVFDPVSKNRYTLSVQVPSVTVRDDSALLTLHCSKNGWVLVSRGHFSFFLLNPFKRGDDATVVLPPVGGLLWFKGISFCSTPGSPDFMMMIIEHHSSSGNDTVTVRTWRPGQDSWEHQVDFSCEVRFVVATHSPLFLDGEFYCLARDGKLGVFNPKTLACRVLEGLEPILDDVYMMGNEDLYAYLLEWKGEVVVVFRDMDVEEPINVYRLDRSQMVWSKLEELADGAIFWDRKQAIALPSSSLMHGFSCNKVYVPTFTETDDCGATSRECVFYSFETKEYSNSSFSLYGLKEPINALWLEPNLNDFE